MRSKRHCTCTVEGRIVRSVALTLLLAFGPAAAASAETIIDLTYDSAMDMVRPEVRPHIVVHHNLHVTISGGNLSEHRDRSTKQYYDRDAMGQVLSSSGNDQAYASWQVAPDGRLMRIEEDPQSTRIMTVTLLAGKTCRLEVVDQLKPGFTEWELLRISNHQMGFFVNYRITSTSCAVRPAAP